MMVSAFTFKLNLTKLKKRVKMKLNVANVESKCLWTCLRKPLI